MTAGPAGRVPATANGATWTCPVEDRTTRPNNGGPPVSSYAVQGVDLSHWNTVPMSDVKAAGKQFVFYKASQGTAGVDTTYAKRTAYARSAGLLVGPYHFFDYRADGVAQARHFVRTVIGAGGFDGRLLPVVDVECVSSFGMPDPARATARLRAFVSEVVSLVGVRPMIYTSIFEWHTVTAGSDAFGDCPLWSAEWAKTAPLKFPPGWSTWLFWQFGSTAAGGTRVDGDAFSGDRAALLGLVVHDVIPPTTSPPAASPRLGASISGSVVPVRLTWVGTDTGGAGVARYELARSTDGGTTWTTVSSTIATAAANMTVRAAGSVVFRVRAVDRAGNVGPWATGGAVNTRIVQQSSGAVRTTGTWATVVSTSYSGGSAKVGRVPGAAATYTFTGRAVAFVTTMAPSRGKARVYVDGALVATVDLYASAAAYRCLAWRQTWLPRRPGRSGSWSSGPRGARGSTSTPSSCCGSATRRPG